MSILIPPAAPPPPAAAGPPKPGGRSAPPDGDPFASVLDQQARTATAEGLAKQQDANDAKAVGGRDARPADGSPQHAGTDDVQPGAEGTDPAALAAAVNGLLGVATTPVTATAGVTPGVAQAPAAATAPTAAAPTAQATSAPTAPQGAASAPIATPAGTPVSAETAPAAPATPATVPSTASQPVVTTAPATAAATTPTDVATTAVATSTAAADAPDGAPAAGQLTSTAPSAPAMSSAPAEQAGGGATGGNVGGQTTAGGDQRGSGQPSAFAASGDAAAASAAAPSDPASAPAPAPAPSAGSGTAAPAATGASPQGAAPTPVVPGSGHPLAAAQEASAAADVAPTRGGVTLDRAVETVRLAMRAGAERGVTHARISLSPQELGGIEIHLRHTADGIVAKVIADSTGAAQLLQQSGGDLRRQLEQQGLNLLRLDIGASGEQAAQAGGQHGLGDPRAGGGSATGSLRTAGPDDAVLTVERDAAPRGATLALPNGALVDVLA